MCQIDSSEIKKSPLFCTILTFLEVIWSEIRESALEWRWFLQVVSLGIFAPQAQFRASANE